MLLNHIKSRDLFSNFSEEKIDSGCGSQNSMQDSQDFLSDVYPSQSTKMYRKYMNEPLLYKSSSQVDLHNKMPTSSSYQNLDYRKLKGKENDDRTLVTAVVSAVKDSSSEVKENLQQIFKNISELLSKNDGSVEQISERFGYEFQKQYEKLLSVFEINNQHKQEIAEKEHQLHILNEQVKSLEVQSCLESKITDIITEQLSAYKSYMNDSLQKFSTSVTKQRNQPTRSFDSDLKTLENQKKEFVSLKTFVQKAFKDLEKRISISSQDIVAETKEMNADINMDLLIKIQDILKSCSREFYDHLHDEFVELYKEQKQEIERNMNLWNETLRLDIKNAFCDLNNSYKQSFKEVILKISNTNNEMKIRMLEFEKELKKLHSTQYRGMNRSQMQNENIDEDNVQFCYPFSEQNEIEKSVMPFEIRRRKNYAPNSKLSNVPIIISTPYSGGGNHNSYDPVKKCRVLKRRARYLMNSEVATNISPFVSPALTLISHATSPGVSVREINLDNKTKCPEKKKQTQYGNEMIQSNSWHVQRTKPAYKKFWDFTSEGNSWPLHNSQARREDSKKEKEKFIQVKRGYIRWLN